MRRRQFIAGLVSAVTWPVVARAQQPDRMRRIGVLQTYARDDPNALARLAAFEQGLQELGWIVGRDIQIDYRFGGTDPDLYRKYAAELVALAPDVILAQGPIGELPQATRTVPIVFVGVTDPVARGLVVSLARPGGNATGFILFEFSLSGKWLGLLKQMAPRVTRVAVIRDPLATGGAGQYAAVQSAASSSGVELTPIGVRNSDEIERDVTAFARAPNGGLIVTSTTFGNNHPNLIITGANIAGVSGGSFVFCGWSGTGASPSDSPALRRARRGRRPDGCARRSPASRSPTDDHARSQSLAGVVGMPESEGPGLSP